MVNRVGVSDIAHLEIRDRDGAAEVADVRQTLCMKVLDGAPDPVQIMDGNHIERGGGELVVEDDNRDGGIFQNGQVVLSHFCAEHEDAERLRIGSFLDAGGQLFLPGAIGDGQGVAVRSRGPFDGLDQPREELCVRHDAAGLAVDQEVDDTLMWRRLFCCRIVVAELIGQVQDGHARLLVDAMAAVQSEGDGGRRHAELFCNIFDCYICHFDTFCSVMLAKVGKGTRPLIKSLPFCLNDVKRRNIKKRSNRMAAPFCTCHA